jgi:hypothetical protein
VSAAAGPVGFAAFAARHSSAHVDRLHSPGIGTIPLVPLEGIGTASGHGSFALLTITPKLGAGDAVGLGLGATGDKMERDLHPLLRVRHLEYLELHDTRAGHGPHESNGLRDLPVHCSPSSLESKPPCKCGGQVS